MTFTPSRQIFTRDAKAASHLGYLDGVRAFAALFVVLHHALLQVSPNMAPLSGWLPGSTLLYYGRYAVDVFIVLSGFCLMLPVLRNEGVLRGGAATFFKRRVWRILPPYYLALLFSLFLIVALIHDKTGTHWDISLPATKPAFLAQFLLVGRLFGQSAKINHAFWSIAVEWWIYFAFPLLLIGWRRWGALATTALTLIASYGVEALVLHKTGKELYAHYLGLFAMGMLAAAFAFPSLALAIYKFPTVPPLWRARVWGLLSFLCAGLVVALSWVAYRRGSVMTAFPVDYWVGACACCVLVLLTCRPQSGLTRCFGWPPLVWVGTFSYSLYLIHAPLLQVLWQYPFAVFKSSPTCMFLALAFLGTPLIVALSYGFFWICERPFLLRGRQTQQAAVVQAALEPAP